jgi:hypothetical protein
MAALFESATAGGLFFDASAAGSTYSSDLDFDYLLSQVGSLSQSPSDDSFYSSTLLDDVSSGNGELSWHVEWFDSAQDIVDLSYGSPRPDDQVKPTLTPATNGRSSGPNVKQSGATAPGAAQKKVDTSRRKVQRCRTVGGASQPSGSEADKSPAIKDEAPTNPQDFVSFELSPEELQFYSDAFINSSTEAPATISPTLLLAPLTPPPSTPATETADITVTTPVQKSKDKPAMDYSFVPLNQASEFFIPDNYGYPLTPGYVDTSNTYMVDMAKSHSLPAATKPKKRARAPAALLLTPPMSNKRKRSDDDEMPAHQQQIAPQVQYKRPRLEQYPSMPEHVPTLGSMPSGFDPLSTPMTEYAHQPDLSPYDTLMSCYTDNQLQYEQYVIPQTPYHMAFQPEEFQHTPPLTPFESMGWYTPQRVNLPKTQQTVWSTPRTLPPQHYPITPSPTPQRKQKDLRRLSLAPNPPPRVAPYPLSPPLSAPPYPVTQQHLLPKLEPYDAAPAMIPPRKEGKKGRKGKNNGGGMFINFTADDRETILSGVAPSGSSKSKKEKKDD